MKKKTGTDYFEKLWKEMFVNYKLFVKTGGQAELHKFRVSIKKLKSLLVLFESGRKRGSLLKRFKPLQKVFKKAGEIRNGQINLELIEKYEIRHDKFQEEQRLAVSNGLLDFRKNRKKYKRKLRDCYRDISSHLHPPGRTSIRSFYKSNLELINSFWKEPQFDEALHTCRKRIKFLLYNHKTANKMLKDEVALDTSYLERLQEKIGSWHDNVMVIELLSPGQINESAIAGRLKAENTLSEDTIRSDAANFRGKVAKREASTEENT